MGFAFGLGAAFFFSLTSILVRIGQRSRPNDDGVFMSVLVNVVVLGSAATAASLPTWDMPAFVVFVIAGIIGTVGGRTALLRAVRLIGATRSNAFLTAAPVVAAVAGWIALGETLAPLEIVGGLIVISGLLWLVRSRSGPTTGQSHVPLAWYLIAAGAPTSFGLAFVFRKWGLERFPSSVFGAFVGAASAYAVIVAIDAARGRLPQRVSENFRSTSWWFVGAGLSTSAALLSQFTAFTYLPAWVVGILQGTQGIWTIGLAALFLRGDEKIDTVVVGSILLVAAGVVLIAFQ